MTEHRDDALTGLHHNRPHGWSGEKEDRLRELWASTGLSCAMIGIRLGVSRNAVIGKVHRMKLEHRANPAKRAKPQPGERNLTHARKNDGLRSTRNDGNTHWRTPQPRLDHIGDANEMVDLPAEQSDCAVPITKLTTLTCRWPLWAASERSGLYCGATPFGELPFCGRHCAVAYRRSA